MKALLLFALAVPIVCLSCRKEESIKPILSSTKPYLEITGGVDTSFTPSVIPYPGDTLLLSFNAPVGYFVTAQLNTVSADPTDVTHGFGLHPDNPAATDGPLYHFAKSDDGFIRVVLPWQNLEGTLYQNFGRHFQISLALSHIDPVAHQMVADQVVAMTGTFSIRYQTLH